MTEKSIFFQNSYFLELVIFSLILWTQNILKENKHKIFLQKNKTRKFHYNLFKVIHSLQFFKLNFSNTKLIKIPV